MEEKSEEVTEEVAEVIKEVEEVNEQVLLTRLQRQAWQCISQLTQIFNVCAVSRGEGQNLQRK